jgi:TonB family protein
LLFLLSAGNVFSQDSSAPVLKENPNSAEDSFKVGDIRGSIKRKGIYLPKPQFPSEAREAGADGVVKVEVTLDAEGNVVEAKAVSGNPLLYKASEEAALKTKFRRAETDDPNLREKGFINYNFTIEKLSWQMIGYELSVLQKAPTTLFFNVPQTGKAFQTDWTEELETLGKIAEMRQTEIESRNGGAMPGKKPVFVKELETSGANQSVMRAEIRLPAINPPTGERIALSQNLIALLQGRLASDETSLWKLNVGINLFKALEINRGVNEGRNAALVLKPLADNAPSGVSADSLKALRELIEIFERPQRSAQTPIDIGAAIPKILKDK